MQSSVVLQSSRLIRRGCFFFVSCTNKLEDDRPDDPFRQPGGDAGLPSHTTQLQLVRGRERSGVQASRTKLSRYVGLFVLSDGRRTFSQRIPWGRDCPGDFKELIQLLYVLSEKLAVKSVPSPLEA